jgi:RHS repeat-associated protein
MDSTGAVVAVNTFGARGLISRRQSAQSIFYTHDPHGNICQRLDSVGGVLTSSIWDAYGSGTTTGTIQDPFGYGGQFGCLTDETGLQCLSARYYDAGAGRFLTRDPISYAGGMNLYGYTGQNPDNHSDPSGLMCDTDDPSPAADNCYTTWIGAHDGSGMRTAVNMYDFYMGWVPGYGTIKGLSGYDMFGCQMSTWDRVWSIGTDMLNFVGGGGADDLGKIGSVGNKLDDVGDVVSVGNKLDGGGCFPAGTIVRMADGSSKPIERVRVGDQVASADEVSGRATNGRVVLTTVRPLHTLLSIRTDDGGEIETTTEHPFWVEGRGFVAAKRLARSDLLHSYSGMVSRVVEITERRGHFSVFNLVVESGHTYYVGQAEWWVHNANVCSQFIETIDDLLTHPVHGGKEHWEEIVEQATKWIDDGYPVTINKGLPGTPYRPDVIVWDPSKVDPIWIIEVIDHSLPGAGKIPDILDIGLPVEIIF